MTVWHTYTGGGQGSQAPPQPSVFNTVLRESSFDVQWPAL